MDGFRIGLARAAAVPMLIMRYSTPAPLPPVNPVDMRMFHNPFGRPQSPYLHRRDWHGAQTLFEGGWVGRRRQPSEIPPKGVQGCALLVAETGHDSIRYLPHHPLLIDDSKQHSGYVVEAKGLQPFDLMAYIVGVAGHQERVDDPLGNYL